MGNVTAKTSGDIASFMTPAETNITSLKVHFSPKQLGEGDPSPDNVREIVGWDGVEVNGSGKNIAHIVGYSAKNGELNAPRYTSNNYGTTINTTDFLLPDTKLVVTQSSYTTEYDPVSYRNGYFAIFVDNLDFEKKYNVSFNVDIINNPLNVDMSRIRVLSPLGTGFQPPIMINGNRLFYKNVSFTPYSSGGIQNLNRKNFEIRNCGMSFTLSKFMVTPVDNEDFEYEPYQGNTISYQWKLPDEYQEVEYIESTGFSWLETSIDIKKNDIVSSELVFQNTSSYTNNVWFAGDGRQKDGLQHEYGFYGNRGYLDDGIIAKYEYGENKYFSKTKAYFLNRTYNSNVTLTWRVGSRNGYSVSEITNCPPCKIWYNSFTINGNKVLELIPCYRKSDGEIGMYDTVSQTFYTNQGTGTFLKGNDVDKTFYGGYVDLISGELVEEYECVKLEDLNWTAKDNRTRTDDLSSSILPPSYSVMVNIIGEQVQPASYSMNLTNYPNAIACSSNGQLIKYYDGENPQGLMAYQLKTPITHQLTPTQLQSFIGQNNFWSNADYVEIEYELKETEDIQKARKKIILNQPQLKTISDKVVSFNTDMVAPMKNCKIYFKPIQLGIGDPSPTNVRNINGWTGLDNYVNGDKISVDWTSDAGTVYGGYLDLAKGEVVATYALFDAYQNRSLFTQGDGNVYIANNQFATYGFVKPINKNESISTHFKAADITTESYPSFSVSNMGHFALRGIPNVTDTVEHFTVYVEEQMNNNTPVQFVMPLVTPIIYQLTPQQLLTIKGWNNYWSNIDTNLKIKYWSHKISPSESNIAYVGENLTFNGTVNSVINTGIYLFNEENINRDFEVVVEGLYGDDRSINGANTVICAKHNGNAYGFLVRINNNSSTAYNGTIAVKINYNNSLIIKRINGVISVTGDLITNPQVKFTNTVHQWPLVLGCAINDDGTYYRFSKGSIKRIIVRWL